MILTFFLFRYYIPTINCIHLFVSLFYFMLCSFTCFTCTYAYCLYCLFSSHNKLLKNWNWKLTHNSKYCYNGTLISKYAKNIKNGCWPYLLYVRKSLFSQKVHTQSPAGAFKHTLEGRNRNLGPWATVANNNYSQQSNIIG